MNGVTLELLDPIIAGEHVPTNQGVTDMNLVCAASGSCSDAMVAQAVAEGNRLSGNSHVRCDETMGRLAAEHSRYQCDRCVSLSYCCSVLL